jgi:hypothetical protein
MTASPAESPQLFSMLSGKGKGLDRTRREAFAFSLIGQALLLGGLTYFTCCVVTDPAGIVKQFPKPADLTLIFWGHNGGGGGNFDRLPASPGNLPRASLGDQIVPPTVIVPREPPKLAVEETVRVAPDVRLPEGGQMAIPCRGLRNFLPMAPVDQAASDQAAVAA